MGGAVEPGHISRNICEISFLSDKDMTDGRKVRGLVERACKYPYAGLVGGFPKQAGATFAAKPPPRIGRTGKPFQATLNGDL